VVSRYLMDLGVPDDRLEIRTYGEARPVVQGSTESAWEKNRRAEMQAGPDESGRHSSR
jgi:outer membrane protein OmpA-like peptidoglycan-associated protein